MGKKYLILSKLPRYQESPIRRSNLSVVEDSSIMKSAALTILCILLLGACALERGHTPATHDPPVGEFTFAVIGCVGYAPAQEPLVDNLLAELNNTPLSFVVHLGDLGAPSRGSCTNELWARRLTQFQASAHPLVYTPGDNEWTDCHEPTFKAGDPQERLVALRATFFSGDQTLGHRRFALVRQSDGPNPEFIKYRENARWDFGGITFITLHVAGSNNGFGRTAAGDAEYAERNRANIAWLQQGFAHAKSHSRALVIIQHANIFTDFPPLGGKPQKPSGFVELLDNLRKEASVFEKPVLLVHADSHYFRVDKPLSPRSSAVSPVDNFTRVETFGAPHHHWVQIKADVKESGVFAISPRIVTGNLRKPE
jgi:hypothetical protein